MDMRHKLLEATARVYAETGYRGATTRRIAQEAGVNEVTLFRHFGSKDALIQEALSHADASEQRTALPDIAVDPRRELVQWCREQYKQLHAIRSIIRKVMGEMEEHPEIVQFGMACPMHAGHELAAYFTRLRASGLARADAEPRAAAKLLMSAVFSEAMSRDIMPKSEMLPLDRAIDNYVDMILRAVGITDDAAARARPTARARTKRSARH